MTEVKRKAPVRFRVTVHAMREGSQDEVSVGFEMTNWRGVYAKPQAFAYLMPAEQAMIEYPMGKLFRLVPDEEDAS